MSTPATIWFRNQDGSYIGNQIRHDGYIQIEQHGYRRNQRPIGYGVGWMLGNYYYEVEDAHEICSANEIINLGRTICETEFGHRHNEDWNHVKFDDICCYGLATYIYIFRNGQWSVLPNFDTKIKGTFSLSSFLDYDDYDRFRDDDSFWRCNV